MVHTEQSSHTQLDFEFDSMVWHFIPSKDRPVGYQGNCLHFAIKPNLWMKPTCEVVIVGTCKSGTWCTRNLWLMKG